MTKLEVANALDTVKTRSAWSRGVLTYARELLDNLAEAELRECMALQHGWSTFKTALLNGADSWGEYSWGGCSLIYDGDIAERLCTPSKLKRTRHGERRPNAREEWLDTQARALTQASLLLWDTAKRLWRLQQGL